MRMVQGLLRSGYELGVAVGLLLVIEVSLRRATLSVTCRRMRVRLDLDGGAPSGGGVPSLPHWTLPRVRAARTVATRWPAGDTCLRRSLLLGNRLRALEPVLRIGVRRDGSGAFEAHSWLEIGGLSLDVDAVEFATLRQPVR